MEYLLKHLNQPLKGSVPLTASKSESNRALLIQSLCEKDISLSNLAAARDTQTMKRLLTEKGKVWDVLDAGTTMRFCTAYLAIFGQGQTITGTPRMCKRPIGILADALIKLGAQIDYQGDAGYPPMKISALSDQLTDHLALPGNISSQYISALLMIAPVLPRGLQLELTTEIFSRPYISMTLGLMERFGVQSKWEDQMISVAPQVYQGGEYTIESDWSGASYWYSMVALSEQCELTLKGLRKNSFQGDQEIDSIMSKLGVKTTYTDAGATIKNTGTLKNQSLSLDFKKCPDLAQTVMVAAALKGVTLKMTGLESLKIKETDRIAAMRNELKKLNTDLQEIDSSHWQMIPGSLPENIASIETYDDHRMAMAFAPICVNRDISIKDPDVVHKSYPDFWNQLAGIGVNIEK